MTKPPFLIGFRVSDSCQEKKNVIVQSFLAVGGKNTLLGLAGDDRRKSLFSPRALTLTLLF
jgi:hypothetical protein